MATKYTRFNKTLRPRQPFSLNPYKKQHFVVHCSFFWRETVGYRGKIEQPSVIIDKMGRENEIEVTNGEK